MFDGVDDPPGTAVVPTDWDQGIPLVSYINHSLKPNCEYDPRSNGIVASRDLRPGEEATVNYYEYQDESTYSVRAARAGFKPSFVQTMYPDPDPES